MKDEFLLMYDRFSIEERFWTKVTRAPFIEKFNVTMTLQDYHDSNDYEVTNQGIQKKPLIKRSLKKEWK